MLRNFVNEENDFFLGVCAKVIVFNEYSCNNYRYLFFCPISLIVVIVIDVQESFFLHRNR